MSRNKSGKKSGWKIKDKKTRQEQNARRNANIAKRALAASGIVDEPLPHVIVGEARMNTKIAKEHTHGA